MNIEEKVFKKEKLNKEKLIPYGFIKEGNTYKYSKKFMNGNFRADIYIDENGNVSGKVYDLEMEEEYTNFRVEDAIGEFVNTVKGEYIKILDEVRDKCFEKEYFIYEQSNRITKLIYEKYNVTPEFLWEKFPNDGVFRNKRSKKWFGIIMNIDKSKIISKESGEIEILNVKLDDEVEKYLKQKGIYPSYHLSKKSWVSIILDDTLSDNEIMKLINISFESSDVKGEWIVPANPKYYDVINAFNRTDTITWKQSNNIIKGDTVYLYVAEPYSAIMFKCEVIETDIPYKYKDKNLSIKNVMKIKLLKRYKQDEFTLKKLNEHGIKSIRGPRHIPKELSKEINTIRNKIVVE